MMVQAIGLPDSIPAKVYKSKIATKAVHLAEDAVNTVEGIMNNLERES
ncbi:MAG: hypothetical protein L5655_03490 [Thermosediminibacteraceae bacterium]|nr:hypothetical protein [Thermosediminibacteraceae bacterium]